MFEMEDNKLIVKIGVDANIVIVIVIVVVIVLGANKPLGSVIP